MKRNTGVAIFLALLAGGTQAADLAECRKIGDDAVRLFCYDRAAGRPAAASAETQTDASVPAQAAAEASATLTVPAEPVPSGKPETPIESRIVGKFEGWGPGTKFKLENGETWEAVGAGTHYSKSNAPKVVIERDFIGQNLMSVEGVKSRAIVRRVED